jgi:hypothetical protein
MADNEDQSQQEIEPKPVPPKPVPPKPVLPEPVPPKPGPKPDPWQDIAGTKPDDEEAVAEPELKKIPHPWQD